MSNNISADLARFNGEIGPQYLDVEDKTGGPDGTMKPITKEVLREMIVTNFPELMNVSDETAQQKLDALDNKLQELDQKLMTLNDIKTQLEGTINTRLTGSNIAQPTDLQYHDLEDENPIPTKEVNAGISEEVTVIEREIRTEGYLPELTRSGNIITPPKNAKGVLLIHRVYSVTGSFDEGEGYKMLFGLTGIKSRGLAPSFYYRTDPSTGINVNGAQFIQVMPGINSDFLTDENIIPTSSGRFKAIPILPQPMYDLRLQIEGTFEEGEGVDSEVVAIYTF